MSHARHLAIAAAVGCAAAGKPAPTVDDRAALVAAMHSYDERIRAMDGPGLAALFTADGAIVNQGQTVAQTPAAIAAFLGGFVGKVRVEATASTVEHVRIEGDQGFLDGRYAQDVQLIAEGKPLHVGGRFAGQWRRDGGAWRLARMETTPDAP
jgi:ketosteroid isomerase-like protein